MARDMHPGYNPHQTFLAAWHLMESVYGEGLWAKEFSFKTRNPALSPVQLQSVPCCSYGACYTTGGLSLNAWYGVPNWIETPWGEWQYSAREPRVKEGTPKDGTNPLRELRAKLDVDEEHSRSSSRYLGIGNDVIAIRSIKGIMLPPYKRVGSSERVANDPTGEWVALLLIHGKPLPGINSCPEWLMEKGLSHVDRLKQVAA